MKLNTHRALGQINKFLMQTKINYSSVWTPFSRHDDTLPIHVADYFRFSFLRGCLGEKVNKSAATWWSYTTLINLLYYLNMFTNVIILNWKVNNIFNI